MSAHRIFCYEPQKAAVIEFLKGLGVVITPDVPHAVSDADQLRGLDHITFVTIGNHPRPIPQRMWELVTTQGAIIIHIDEQYARGERIIPIRHYPGVAQ